MNKIKNNPMATIKVNDTEIDYKRVGNGPRTLLICPEVFGITNSFQPLIENLDPEKYTIISWSRRQPDFSPGYLYRDADCAISLMEALRVDKYSLLGWCNGGRIALVAASKAVAGRVEGLVVWGTNVYVTGADLEYLETTRDVRRWAKHIIDKLMEVHDERYISDTWNAFVDSIQRALEDDGGDICRDSLHTIDTPALIMHGAQDNAVSVDHAIYLHENIRHSSLEIFPQGGHAIHYAFTEQFNAMVDNFLTSAVNNKCC